MNKIAFICAVFATCVYKKSLCGNSRKISIENCLNTITFAAYVKQGIHGA